MAGNNYLSIISRSARYLAYSSYFALSSALIARAALLLCLTNLANEFSLDAKYGISITAGLLGPVIIPIILCCVTQSCPGQREADQAEAACCNPSPDGFLNFKPDNEVLPGPHESLVPREPRISAHFQHLWYIFSGSLLPTIVGTRA